MHKHAQSTTETDSKNTAAENKPQTQPYSWKSILLSVVSAAFGVQSQKNRERDFAQGRLIHFIVGGCLFVAGFVGFIYFMVQLALQWG
jgi:hypothetical protein